MSSRLRQVEVRTLSGHRSARPAWYSKSAPWAGRHDGFEVAYSVKEIYHTLQGEGARAGRAAVFCRFAGCNLWSGREVDRSDAACGFCDTDFVGTDGPGGGRFATATDLVEAIARTWNEATVADAGTPYVVFTGGEPLLQLDEALVEECHRRGFEVAVETNGTVPPPRGIDWLTVSPKPSSELVVKRGQELKLVFPHEVTPESVADLDFSLFYLQPMDGPRRAENTALAVAYCRSHPRWRLSLQTHKLVGIP
jgi:7-carboxy-7-deazaguanine synthase (Cx14CxxC type)